MFINRVIIYYIKNAFLKNANLYKLLFVRFHVCFKVLSNLIIFVLFQVNKTFSPLVDAVEISNQWLEHWSVQVLDVLTNSSEHLSLIEVSGLVNKLQIPFFHK